MSTSAEKHFWMQVAELGFSDQQEQGGHYIRSPEGTRSWYLYQQDDRWVLYVRDVPQIVFHPDEVLKFLEKQTSLGNPLSPTKPTQTNSKRPQNNRLSPLSQS